MKFVSLDKYMTEDDGNDAPEPVTDPTWEDLVALDARLPDLPNLARSYHRSRRRRFGANHVYVWELKPRLEDQTGCARRGGPRLLRSKAAYDVARKTVYDALLGCRGCACIPHGGAW